MLFIDDLVRLFPYIFPKIVFCLKSCEEKVREAFKVNNLEGFIVVFDDKKTDLEAFVQEHNGTEVDYRYIKNHLETILSTRLFWKRSIKIMLTKHSSIY